MELNAFCPEWNGNGIWIFLTTASPLLALFGYLISLWGRLRPYISKAAPVTKTKTHTWHLELLYPRSRPQRV